MRNELLKGMIKEEIRMHSSLHGMKNVMLFPIFLFFATFLFCMIIFGYSTFELDYQMVGFGFAMIFFILGIVSGAFGLYATDYLERRFGDFGKLFSNAQLLPIKLSDIFLVSAISDSLFYLGWFIMPIFAGFGLSVLMLGLCALALPLLLLSTIFAFIIGITTSFFLSVLFTKSRKVFAVIIIIIGTLFIRGFYYQDTSWFLPYTILADFSIGILIGNIGIIAVMIMLSMILVGNEFNIRKKKTSITSFHFRNINPFIFKDYIDLYRSHGIIAKPLFNVVIPSLLMIGLLSSLTFISGEFSIITQNLVFFAIVIGTLSINFFNILLMGDSYSYYQFLPISLKDFMMPKVIITQFLCSLQGIIIIIIYAYLNNLQSEIIVGILTLIGIIYYTMATNFLINGLKPNENSLNIVSLVSMALALLPILIAGMILPFFFKTIIVYLLFCILLISLGQIFFRKGFLRWNAYHMQ